jgi:hypothetical protein
MIAPFIGYSQKQPTNTLKPEFLSKINGVTIFGMNRSQMEHLITEKNSKDICFKQSLYKDSIIGSKDSIIDDLNFINKSTKELLDTCGFRYDRSVKLVIKKEEEIKILKEDLNKKNIQLSFLGGTTLAIIIAMLLL